MSRPSFIYLDYASTTPLDPSVAEVMMAKMLGNHGNPASQHRPGQAARKELESARSLMITMLGGQAEGMNADRLIFTSGGTEANNLALLGRVGTATRASIVSSIEHPSIAGPADELARRGVEVRRIRATADGVVDVEHARELLKSDPPAACLSVMLANNETGVVQPVRELALLGREYNVPLHADAVQFVGKSPMEPGSLFANSGAASFTVSAHKIYGPVGIGALLLRHGETIQPQLFGGFQQEAFRPGTESLAMASGFLEALGGASIRCDATRGHLIRLRDAFESGLRNHLNDLVINGEAAERLPHISNVAFLGVDRQQLFLALDFAGVYCSTGSACASGSSEPSPVLRAMGLPEGVVSSSLRFSFGAPTTADDIAESVERIVKCVKDLRSRKSARK